ncbi:zinc finger protein [Oryctes borbonicus]|uniref:Zinc finger protein n=1 Tax=Oryctes borbonicus TaxID=1629725 RepID=A0A0T6AZ71_9SCAR|nr:zinc finger protein [Oryctes borbonicus]
MVSDQTINIKTDRNPTNAGNVWTTNSDLPQLTHDECSILSHLEPSDKGLPSNLEVSQNMEFIVFPNTDYKLTIPLNSVAKSNNTKNPNRKIIQEDIKPKTCHDLNYIFCDLCPFFCTSEKRLTDHIHNVHENGNTIKLIKLKCPACINIFYHKISLRSHLVNDHLVTNPDLNKIMGMILKKRETNKIDLNKNNPRSNNIGINCKNEFDLKYGDKLCKLSSEKILSEEKVQHTSEMLSNGILSCEISDTSVIVNLPTVEITPNNTEKMFNSYIKKHNSLTKFFDKKMQKCTIPQCKVKLQNMEKLNYHLKCHVDASFKCPECNEAFSFWKPLTGHLWRLHKIDMELYACDKCEYKTFSLGHLNNVHKLIHSDTKSFVCNICLRGFKNSKQLRNHKSTHKRKTEKTSNFICEVCLKSFSDRRQLRIHTDGVHKKIKPFLCNFCGYKGSTKSSLRMHMRQHTGEKPFSCDSCSYATADHNSMRRHKLRHTGEKPYKCVHCDYACIQSSTYKVHLKTKHPGLEKDLLYSCPDCTFRSINKDMFNTHLLTVHKLKTS